MPLTQESRSLAVTTPLGEDVLFIRSMSAAESLSALFQYDLDLISENVDIRHEDLLGRPATVRLTLPQGGERYFNGIVSRFSFEGYDGAVARFRATLVPWLWFLTRTSDCRIYQQATVPDIVKGIFREHGFTDFEERLSGTYREWVYCVQYRETDFNFVSRLLEEEGIYYYFVHEADKHTLVLADDYSSHEPVAGYEEVPYYPPDETALRERDYIDDWTIATEVQPGRFAHKDFDFTAPKKDLLGINHNPREHELADLEIFDYPGEYMEPEDGEHYARIRLEEMQADYQTAQAQGNARGLTTGALFSLTDYPREDQNREYLIVSADFEMQSGPFGSGTGGPAGPVFRCGIRAIDAQNPYRPPRVTPKPIVQGPQTAIVVGADGEEIWTDEYGRVKVQFHWDRYGELDENSSCWVRVSHPWAGKGWGSVAIPRIGQEVIVDFLEGDPDQPIITGRVYNQDNMPPYELPGGAVVSGLKSNTHKGQGYNEISMDDTDGQQQLNVHGQHDANTTIEHDQTLTVHNNRTSTIDVDDAETIGGNQTRTVEGNQTNSITGNRQETVDGNEGITIHGTREETVDGSESITINSTRAEHVTGAEEVTIDAATKHTINANYDRKVTGNYTLDADGNIKNTAGSNWEAKAGSKAFLIAEEITIKGRSKIELVSGDSKITLEPGKVTLSTGGIIEEGAGADFKMKGAKISLN